MQLLTNRAPKRRRSQTRLGTTTHEAAAVALPLRLAPVEALWKGNAARLPGLLLAGALLWVLFQFFDSETFFVYEATISGNNNVSAEEIFQRAGIEGENIFFLDHSVIEARLERTANIRSAAVRCQLPATIDIQVVEREPVYMWQVGDKTYWLDSDGVVMEPIGPAPETITLIDADGQAIQPGMRVSHDILDTAAEVHKWLPNKKTFQWTQANGLSFQNDDGYPVYLGKADDLAAKMATLTALSQGLAEKKVRPKFIDLRFSGRPYYR
jgi:cell division septal protein FtsQ